MNDSRESERSQIKKITLWSIFTPIVSILSTCLQKVDAAESRKKMEKKRTQFSIISNMICCFQSLRTSRESYYYRHQSIPYNSFPEKLKWQKHLSNLWTLHHKIKYFLPCMNFSPWRFCRVSIQISAKNYEAFTDIYFQWKWCCFQLALIMFSHVFWKCST